MKKITVLLPEAEVERHIIDICSDSTKFDVGRGLFPFDKILLLPGPPRKTIFLRQAQENSKPIGYVHILPVRNNSISIVKFVAESLSADFDEFARLVTGYFQDLNLLAEPLSTKPTDQQGQVEKPKQRGRYRLTPDDINKRKEIVEKAQQMFDESNTKITWKQIADNLDIPERTLREWRHNPLY